MTLREETSEFCSRAESPTSTKPSLFDRLFASGDTNKSQVGRGWPRPGNRTRPDGSRWWAPALFQLSLGVLSVACARTWSPGQPALAGLHFAFWVLLAHVLSCVLWVFALRRRVKAPTRAEESALLATLSHELRAPLNGIQGMSSLLSRTTLDERQSELVATLRSCADNLLLLVNDALDFARLEVGRLPIVATSFDPRAVVHEVLAMNGPRAREKELALFAVVERSVAARVVGDPMRVRQVLTNLVTNAVKFTARGEVEVRVAACGPKRLAFSVRDTGIGIRPDAHGRIFEPFSQADDTIARDYGGSGLGLAICRRLVRAMGGTIAFESTPGVGTRFVFELPLPAAVEAGGSAREPNKQAGGSAREPNKQAGGSAREPNKQAGGSAREPNEPPPDTARDPAQTWRFSWPARILVVEDAAVNRVVAEALLAELGVSVQMARDGAEALTLLREAPFDLILMDCHLPLLHGLEVVQTLRAEPGPNQRTPVIALTAGVEPELERACRKAGMDDYLEKPIRRSELMGKLDRWLSAHVRFLLAGEAARFDIEPEAREGDRSSQASPRVPQRGPGEAPLVCADTPDLVELETFLRAFEREAGSSATSQLAATYRDSVPEVAHALARAARQGESELDRLALARQAHTLRGAARSMGLCALASTLTELERACHSGEQALLERLSADVEARLLWVRDALSRPRAEPAPSPLNQELGRVPNNEAVG